jgi:hypothetical protein
MDEHRTPGYRARQGIGFWGFGRPGEFPRPQALVRPEWRPKEREQIAAYLECGHVFLEYMGGANCRFPECGLSLGSVDLTDGDWVWPEGLEHYVTTHAICLPDQFVATMAARGWDVPSAVPPVDPSTLFEDLRRFDLWLGWAADFEAEYSRTHPPTGVMDWLPSPSVVTLSQFRRRWWQVWKPIR